MRLYCVSCKNALTEILLKSVPTRAYDKIMAQDSQEFPKYKMKKGLYYKCSEPEAWVYDEETGKSTPSGEFRDYWVVAEESLTGVQIKNASIGCCRFDSFDVACGKCEKIVGDGQNDCWQTDNVMLKVEMVYKDC